jgi:hypothetical protein
MRNRWLVLGLIGGYMAFNALMITLAGMWDVVFAMVGPISVGLVIAELLFWSGLFGGGYAAWKGYLRMRANRRQAQAAAKGAALASVLVHR